MHIHGSCVSRNEAGVLLLGPSGSGKSDLALRLIDRGFILVADDRVDIAGGIASAPATLAGLLEVRGIGIVVLPHAASTRLGLAVQLGATPERLPHPETHLPTGLPMITLNAFETSAAQRVELALALALGQARQSTGAFAP